MLAGSFGYNIGFNRTTYQSSVNYGFVPSYAVDGNRVNTYTQTRNEINPWWAVDLGERYYISLLIISSGSK